MAELEGICQFSKEPMGLSFKKSENQNSPSLACQHQGVKGEVHLEEHLDFLAPRHSGLGPTHALALREEKAEGSKTEKSR